MMAVFKLRVEVTFFLSAAVPNVTKPSFPWHS